jgi:hypothetical protein
MVRASRKKLIVALSLLAAAIVVSFAAWPVRGAACLLFLSPAERKVLGEWQSSMIGGVAVTTIHADHTWTSAGGSCFGDGGPHLSGRWRLDGTDLVFSFTPGRFGRLAAPSPARLSVQQLIDDDRQTRLEALSDSKK